MSVKAFELVPAIERVSLLSEKASSQVCYLYIILRWKTAECDCIYIYFIYLIIYCFYYF